MKQRLLCIFCILSFVQFSFTQLTDFSWAVTTDGGTFEESFVVDDIGNSYVTGSMFQTVDFDPGAGIYNLSSSGTSYNGFIQKIDKHGHFAWAKKLSGNQSIKCTDIAIGESGFIYVTGTYSGTVDFDPGPIEYYITNSKEYGDNTFVLKLDENGNFVNVITFGDDGQASSLKIISDGINAVYLVSYVNSNTDINPGNGTFYFTNTNERLCLMKLDRYLNFEWGESISGTGLYGLAVDNESNIYTTGYRTYVHASGMNTADIVTLKYDSSGNFKWTFTANDDIDHNDWGNSIAVDSNGYVYSVGIFKATIDMDPSSNEYNLTSNGNHNYWIQKLDSLGNFIWAQSYGNPTYSIQPLDISIKPNNNLLITGYCGGIIDFDNGLNSAIVNCGARKIFMHELDQYGNFMRIETFGNESTYERGIGVKSDAEGNIYLHCHYRGYFDFETNDGIYTLPPYGSHFIVRMGSAVSNLVDKTDFDISLYPNPTTGLFSLVQSNNSETSIMSSIIDVTIYDYNGSLLKKISSSEILTQIDINNYATGVYFVHVNFYDITQVLKLLKQ